MNTHIGTRIDEDDGDLRQFFFSSRFNSIWFDWFACCENKFDLFLCHFSVRARITLFRILIRARSGWVTTQFTSRLINVCTHFFSSSDKAVRPRLCVYLFDSFSRRWELRTAGVISARGENYNFTVRGGQNDSYNWNVNQFFIRKNCKMARQWQKQSGKFRKLPSSIQTQLSHCVNVAENRRLS